MIGNNKRMIFHVSTSWRRGNILHSKAKQAPDLCTEWLIECNHCGATTNFKGLSLDKELTCSACGQTIQEQMEFDLNDHHTTIKLLSNSEYKRMFGKHGYADTQKPCLDKDRPKYGLYSLDVPAPEQPKQEEEKKQEEKPVIEIEEISVEEIPEIQPKYKQTEEPPVEEQEEQGTIVLEKPGILGRIVIGMCVISCKIADACKEGWEKGSK